MHDIGVKKSRVPVKTCVTLGVEAAGAVQCQRQRLRPDRLAKVPVYSLQLSTSMYNTEESRG